MLGVENPLSLEQTLGLDGAKRLKKACVGGGDGVKERSQLNEPRLALGVDHALKFEGTRRLSGRFEGVLHEPAEGFGCVAGPGFERAGPAGRVACGETIEARRRRDWTLERVQIEVVMAIVARCDRCDRGPGDLSLHDDGGA